MDTSFQNAELEALPTYTYAPGVAESLPTYVPEPWNATLPENPPVNLDSEGVVMLWPVPNHLYDPSHFLLFDVSYPISNLSDSGNSTTNSTNGGALRNVTFVA